MNFFCRSIQIGRINPKQIPKPPEIPLWKRKVKYYGEQIGYSFVILAGIGCTAIMTFGIDSDYFKSKQPQLMYEEVAPIVIQDSRVQAMIGTPITVSNSPNLSQKYELFSQELWNGKQKRIQIQFYLHANKIGICTVEATSFKDSFNIDYVVVSSGGKQVILTDKNRIGRFGFGKPMF